MGQNKPRWSQACQFTKLMFSFYLNKKVSIILCQRCTKLLWLFVIICINANQVTCQFANIVVNRHYLKQHRPD